MTHPMLEARGLTKYFPLSRGYTLQAVDAVSFSIYQGEIVGIVGESGCGKSTLARLLLRLIEASAGTVFFKNQEITALSQRELTPLRRSMQMVFQNPFGSFNPAMTLYQTLMEVCRYYNMSRSAGHEKIIYLLDMIGLTQELLSHRPRELSGGQLQRLAIARALLPGPEFLIADEALSALDVSVQAQLLNLLSDLQEQLGTTMLFISHDITVVEYFCDRVAVMYLGKIVEITSSRELFKRPLHPYTQTLVASTPRLDSPGVLHRAVPSGELPNPLEKRSGCPFAPRCPKAEKPCLETSPALRTTDAEHFVACHKV